MSFKSRVRNGEYLLGTMITVIENPNLPKILKNCGYDFITIDCEHGSFTYSDVARLVGAARDIQLPAIVRIPEIRREPVLKYMEMGSSGLLLPNSETVEQAKLLVEYSKYAPMGKRGVSLSRPHTDFKKVDGKSYMETVNEETILMCQIESAEGIRNLPGILAVNGIDVAFVGPNDLSQDLGILGRFDDPLMEQSLQTILAAASAAKKTAGIHFGGEALTAKWAKKGFTMNMCGTDISLLIQGAAASLAESRGGIVEATKSKDV